MEQPRGDGSYNRSHDATMERDRRQRERQEWLASLTPEQRTTHNEERRELLQDARRRARTWAQIVLYGRNEQNVISDENSSSNNA